MSLTEPELVSSLVPGMEKRKCVYVTPLSGTFTVRVVASLWGNRLTPDVLIVKIRGDRPGFIMDFAEYEQWLRTNGPTDDLSNEDVAMNMSEEIDAIFASYKAAIPVIKTF